MDQEWKSLLVRIIRFAIIMLIVVLIVGLFYREYSRKFLFKYPMTTQTSVGHHLSLAHGHTALLGTIIPFFLAFLIFIIKGSDRDNEIFRTLKKVFGFYIIGALASLFLLYYKGSAIIYLFQRSPELSLEAIDKTLFFGNELLRLLLYFLSHTIFGVSLVYFLGMVFIRLKKITVQ